MNNVDRRRMRQALAVAIDTVESWIEWIEQAQGAGELREVNRADVARWQRDIKEWTKLSEKLKEGGAE